MLSSTTSEIRYALLPAGSGVVYLAVDPFYYEPLQTGWQWIFTPVKGSVVVYGWTSTARPAPWYDIYLYNSHYLDIRVAALEVFILVILIIIIPLWCTRHRLPARRFWSLISATAGLWFGWKIVEIGYSAMSMSEVLFMAGGLTLALYYLTLSEFVLGPRTTRRGEAAPHYAKNK